MSVINDHRDLGEKISTGGAKLSISKGNISSE